MRGGIARDDALMSGRPLLLHPLTPDPRNARPATLLPATLVRARLLPALLLALALLPAGIAEAASAHGIQLALGERPGAGPTDQLEPALLRFREAMMSIRPVGNNPMAREDALDLFSDILGRTHARYVRVTDPGKLVDKAVEGLIKQVGSAPESNDQQLVEAALEAMLSSLDPYSAYLNETEFKSMQALTQGEFGGLGIELTADEKSGLIRVVSPIDGTPAARAGIRTGDLIAQIDGAEVRGLSLRDAVNRMRGDAGSRIRLTLKRDSTPAPFTLTLTRAIIHIEPVRFHTEGDVGYVRITTFNQNTASSLDHALDSLRRKLNGHFQGLIIDLRNNPGGLLDQAIAVAGRFLVNEVVVSVRGRDAEENRVYHATGEDQVAGLPVVLLTNGGSASASEIVAAALQDQHRAVLIGTRTYGKGSVQTVSPLPGGDTALRLTTARYYRPSGYLVDCFGVSPNLEVTSGPLANGDLPEPEAHQATTNCDPNVSPPPPPQVWTAQNLCPHLPPTGKPGDDRPLACALEAVRGYLVARH